MALARTAHSHIIAEANPRIQVTPATTALATIADTAQAGYFQPFMVTIPSMKSALPTITLPLALLALQASCIAQTNDEALLPDGQQSFIAALHERLLFDLAEQHCRRQLEASASRNQQALWLLLITDGCEQKLPLLPAKQRPELVTKAATDITEFITERLPGPVTEVLLRVRQVELLATAARLESQPELLTLDSAQPPLTPLPLSGRRRDFALAACQQGSELATGLLKHIEQLRSELDPALVRSCRLRLQFAIAHCLHTRSRLADDNEIPALQKQLDEDCKTLERSSGDADRFAARLLLADSLLDRRDFPACQLQLRRLQPDIRSPADRLAATTLQLRLLLLQGKPSEALQVSVDSADDNLQQHPQLLLLRLHALLRRHELLLEMQNASADRQQSLLNTATEFQQLAQKLLTQTSGVLLETTQRLQQRFALSLQVGPKAASTLERINERITAEDYQTARSELRQLAASSGQQSVIAYTLMQAGELSLRLADWTAALTELEQSTAAFMQQQDPARAASADLLRLYCLGQLWTTAPDKEKTTRQAAYRDAVERHLQNYAKQNTAPAARLYRIRYLRSKDPLLAADDVVWLLQQKSPAPTAPLLDQSSLLALLADLLITQAASQTAPADEKNRPHLQQLSSTFREFNTSPTPPEHPAATALSLQLAATVLWQTNSETPASDWQLLARTTDSAIAQQVNTISPADSENSPRLPDDFAELQQRSLTAARSARLLAACRLLEPDNIVTPILQSLSDSSPELRQLALLLLLPHISQPGEPGTPQLAARLSRLHQSLHQPADSVDQKLQWLSVEARLTNISGNTETLVKHLTELLLLPLNPQQLSQLATVAQTLPAITRKNQPATNQLISFWQKIRSQHKSGDDLWLEASLRLAEATAADGRRNDALRMLQVVSVLHPAWGNPARLQRANALQKQLESAP